MRQKSYIAIAPLLYMHIWRTIAQYPRLLQIQSQIMILRGSFFWLLAFALASSPFKVRIPYGLGGRPQSTYTELQPLLSGVHSVIRVKFALAGEGGGCTPTPFYYIYHHRKVAVYAPAE